MPKDISDIACAIAGPITQRTLENLRRHLEELYIKSTAQGSTPEDQAAFNDELIAQAHLAAREDNAQTIMTWATAIYDRLSHSEFQTREAIATPQKIKRLRRWIETDQRKIRSWEKQLRALEAGTDPELTSADHESLKKITAQGIQAVKNQLSRREQELRHLLQSAS
jgi:hypothetical protein